MQLHTIWADQKEKLIMLKPISNPPISTISTQTHWFLDIQDIFK